MENIERAVPLIRPHRVLQNSVKTTNPEAKDCSPAIVDAEILFEDVTSLEN